MSRLAKLRQRRAAQPPLPDMVVAEDLARTRRASGVAQADVRPSVEPALLARRDRIAERLTTLQLELGGVYYEMAIRDHVVLDVLNERAARMQLLDSELAHVDALIESGAGSTAGACPSCHAPHARGAAFCWQCGSSLGIDAASA